jgi:hypothetical protein
VVRGDLGVFDCTVILLGVLFGWSFIIATGRMQERAGEHATIDEF